MPDLEYTYTLAFRSPVAVFTGLGVAGFRPFGRFSHGDGTSPGADGDLRPLVARWERILHSKWTRTSLGRKINLKQDNLFEIKESLFHASVASRFSNKGIRPSHPAAVLDKTFLTRVNPAASRP